MDEFLESQLIFCIDYSQLVTHDKQRLDLEAETVPELVHRNAQRKKVAAVFHAEGVKLSFQEIRTESERLAAAFLAIGLKVGDRCLICGSNESLVFLSLLSAARAGLIFCLANPNFTNSEQLKRLLSLGEFKALICFKSQVRADHLFTLLREAAPELLECPRGKLKAAAFPSLTHIILAEEEHRHAGTYTLSDVAGRTSAEKVSRLPAFEKWNQNDMAALQLTMGSTGEPRLVGLSHFQLLGGARAVNHAFGIQQSDRVAVALPLFRGPLLSLLCLSPFLTHCQIVFPDAQPVPSSLFSCISVQSCSVLLSNGAALRLLLKTCQMHRARLASLLKVLLIGERVPNELQLSIQKHANRVQIIAVGYLLTETGSVPIMGDQTCNLTRNVGKPIAGYSARLSSIEGSTQLGELLISPFQLSTFLGYAPDFTQSNEWIRTGDVAELDAAGNFCIVSHISDLIYDKSGHIFNHRAVEKVLALSPHLKGVQVICAGKGEPVVAVCVVRRAKEDPDYLKGELVLHCRNTSLPIPDKFCFLEDFPRTNTRIQKYKLREWLQAGKLQCV